MRGCLDGAEGHCGPRDRPSKSCYLPSRHPRSASRDPTEPHRTELLFRSQACRAILAKYGLCMPSLQFLQDPVDHKATDSPASPCSKPESLVIIALPPFGVTSAASADEQPSYPTPSVSYDKYFNDAVWNVSFDLPACADDRFRALVRDYHLDVVDVHDGTLALAGTRAEKAGAESSRQVESVKSVRAIQPRWKLFTTVVCDW